LRIFKELQQRHPQALAGKTAELRSYTGPDQKPWFHVLAAPPAAKDKASELCRLLGEEGQALGCNVVTY
jgi:hypothetical protein